MLCDYASMRWDRKEIRSARRGGLFGWLRSRRRAERSVDETTRRLVKSIGADEPSLGPDPIEELVRMVGSRTHALGAMLASVRHLRAAPAQTVEDRR